MSEVLITLGIIGVVAALTLPTIITKHQKNVTATRLKQSYTILSQAFMAAQAEYGDTSSWDCYFTSGIPSGNLDNEKYLKNLAQKYILPYLESVKDYGYVNASMKYGYKGSTWTSYFFMLPNETLVETNFSMGCDEKGQDANGCVGQHVYVNFTLRLDVNGFKGPNKLGKDIFVTTFLPTGKYRMFAYSTGREDALDFCKTNGSSTCGYLIQIDGWQIKDDYPW